ncbi:hypothetical protein MHYP_G00199570 [Metynnis hypsauchen]
MCLTTPGHFTVDCSRLTAWIVARRTLATPCGWFRDYAQFPAGNPRKCSGLGRGRAFDVISGFLLSESSRTTLDTPFSFAYLRKSLRRAHQKTQSSCFSSAVRQCSRHAWSELLAGESLTPEVKR